MNRILRTTSLWTTVFLGTTLAVAACSGEKKTFADPNATAGGGTGGSGGTDCTPSGMVCDPVPQECVDCLFDTDCQSDERCVDRACGPVTACVNSLDCADTAETVCDESVGQCVECVSEGDCDANNDCFD